MPDPEGIAIPARKPAESLAGKPRSPSLPVGIPRDRPRRRLSQPPSNATVSPAHTLALASALAQTGAGNDSPGVLALGNPATDPTQKRSQEQNQSQQTPGKDSEDPKDIKARRSQPSKGSKCRPSEVPYSPNPAARHTTNPKQVFAGRPSASARAQRPPSGCKGLRSPGPPHPAGRWAGRAEGGSAEVDVVILMTAAIERRGGVGSTAGRASFGPFEAGRAAGSKPRSRSLALVRADARPHPDRRRRRRPGADRAAADRGVRSVSGDRGLGFATPGDRLMPRFLSLRWLPWCLVPLPFLAAGWVGSVCWLGWLWGARFGREPMQQRIAPDSGDDDPRSPGRQGGVAMMPDRGHTWPNPAPTSSAGRGGRIYSYISGAARTNAGPVATGKGGTRPDAAGTVASYRPQERPPEGGGTPTEGLTRGRTCFQWLTRTLRAAMCPSASTQLSTSAAASIAPPARLPARRPGSNHRPLIGG